jgi:RHS repeat-associated protein
MKKLLILFLILSVHLLRAGDETRNFRVYASNLGNNSFIECRDDKFTGAMGWNCCFTNYSNKTVIELGLDEEKHLIHGSFKVCAKFDLELTDANLTTTVLAGQQLDINYEPAELTRYKDKAQLIFYGYYKVTVKNIQMSSCAFSVSCSSCTLSPPADAYLQAEITTTRIYPFNFTDQVGSYGSSYSGTNNELNIYWGYAPGAESYELEYTYIDDYSSTLGAFVSSSSINYDLDHDATRICTPYNNFKLPLNYEHGYIVYRIRPIGTSSLNVKMEGSWNGAPAQGLVSGTGAAYNISTAFSSDYVNWSGTQTFAELGRTGTGVSFMDAMGFKRQSIARLNTESKSIAQSTLYDHQGRPMINILPAPVSGLNFDYRFGLNKITVGGSTVNFDKGIYDVMTGTVTPLCSVSGLTLNPVSSSGAANYYSSSNSNKQGQQAYVPDGENMPYTHVLYKPDGLGRISSQSMPGFTHRLGGGKEMKYWYAKPAQVELDRLFGSEAGKAINYFKNFVQDPNGQLSTTYLDEHGRTVATALLGNSPGNVDDLPNKPSSQLFVDILSDAPTNWTDTVNKCKEVNTTIFISSAFSSESYTYNTTLGTISSPCDTSNICFDCRYDLEISIKDECGNEIWNYSNTPPAPYFNQIGAAAPYNSVSCSYTGSPTPPTPNGNYFSLSNTPISITFPKVGTYSIHKKICVNNDPLPDYKDILLDNQTCIDQCDLFNGLLNAANFNGCLPMTCQSCTAQVAAYVANNYTNTVGQVIISPQEISQMYQNCAIFCQPNSQCEKYERMLEADFYPNTGQYATTNTASPTYSYSIFKPSNLLVGSPTWSTPSTPPYQNAVGQNDQVMIAGTTYSPQQLSENQFINFFKHSWAKAFLPAHPEYCKLYFYCNIIDATLKYDDHIKGIAHYDSACATNYVLPFTFTPAAGPSTACIGTPNTDPVYTLATTYPGFSTAINNFTSAVAGNMIGSGKDIYSFVATAMYGGTANIPTGHYFGSDACAADIEWNKYKGYYMAQKYYLYQDLLTAFLASPSTYSFAGTCTTVPSGFGSHFPSWADSVQNVLGNVGSPGPLGPFTNTTQLAAVGGSLANQAWTVAAANCSANCAAYAGEWFQNLNEGCPAFATSNATVQNNILNAMQGVCMLGCDGYNPFGASSVASGTYYTIPGTSATVTTFQGVLDYYLGTNTCSAIVVTNPKPYPANINNPGTTLSDCGCNKLLQAEYDFNNMVPLPSGVDAAWKMFRYENGYDMAEYNTLLCACKTSISGYTWTPTFTWSVSQLTTLATYSNIPVSPKLACTTCIKCSDVVNAINSMTAQLPSPVNYTIYGNPIDAITQDSVNYIFAINSLNSQFNANHDIYFYTMLYQDCQDFNNGSPSVALTFSNNITPKSLELYRYMNSLMKKGKFTVNHNTSLCIDDKYYLSSLYTSTFAPGTPTGLSVYSYTYNAASSANVFTLSILNGTTSLHQIQLTAPSTYTTWSRLKSMSNFKAYCPSAVAGNNYTFVVDAKDRNLTVVTLTGQVQSLSIPICNLSTGTPQPQYCKPAPANTVISCIADLVNNIQNQVQQQYQDTLNALANMFELRYKKRCLDALNENFIRQYNFPSEYNYTLYYYDEAGNLHRTVAPNGVGTPSSAILPITQPIAVGTTTYPAYSSTAMVNNYYVNEYRHNSYNEPLQESTIDGGQTTYFYDKFGRIMVSQNAKQASMGNVYSYTRYDAIGRIVQVGQIVTTSPISSVTAESSATLNPVLTSTANTRTEVTSTYYDNATASSTILAKFTGSVQEYLRNRVAYIQYEETDDNDTTTCDKATFYSYDDHGNVNEMVQYIKDLVPLGKGLSKVAYEHELISGNVTKASYEPGMPDQFMHKYEYDDDNRLHVVYTSRDNQNWDRDAKYFYYEHGLLARIERADKQVQGADYFYTIHGWIKGINSDGLQINADAGKDAAYTSVYLTNYNSIHGWFANDAMAFSLKYYDDGTNKDYTSINNANYNTSNNFNPLASTTNLANTTFSLAGNGPSLYNGNISSMVTDFINKDQFSNTLHPVNNPFPQLAAFHYDQLHRITQMKAYSGPITPSLNAWTTPTNAVNYDNSYFMNFIYDDNGNIRALQRMGAGSVIKSGLALYMDSLQYRYMNIANSYSVNTNKLMSLKETAASTYSDDIDAPTSYPGTDRYDYDAIGNLIKDDGEYIASIEWTVDRKVKKVTRDAAALTTYSVTKSDLEYQYDGLRRRVAKIEKPRDPSTKALLDESYWIYTYYNYDASGNVMAVYTRTAASIGGGITYSDKLSLEEQYVYGSGRLAVKRPEDIIQWTATYTICGSPTLECRTYSASPAATSPTVNFAVTQRRLGYKEFELDNHLGNVVATVSDRKIQYVRCKVFNGNPIGPTDPTDNNNFRTFGAVNSNTTVFGSTAGSDSLEVQPITRFGGIDQSFTAAVTGSVYTMVFDVNIGTTTAADSLYAKLYGYNPATGIGGSDSAYVLINSSGHYELTYTAEPATMNFKMYYNGVNTSTATGRSFYTQNLYISDARPLNPISPPTASVNILATCNPIAGADFLHYFPDLLMHTDYYAFGQEMPGRKWQGTSDNYRYDFNKKEDDKTSGWYTQDYGFRTYDYRLGRFYSVDPLKKKYPELTPYQFASNTPLQAIDLDGLEAWFMLAETPPTGPVLKNPLDIDVELVAKTAVEQGVKSGAENLTKGAAELTKPIKYPKFTREHFEAFKRGLEAEKEQLSKAGLEKNTKPFTEEVNGEDVTTIPDAVKPNGGTVEIKNVQRQGLTKQLKAQEKISNKNGVRPELIINKSAKISKPLKESSFDIKFYQANPTPTAPRDNTNVIIEKQITPPSGSCSGDPKCL